MFLNFQVFALVAGASLALAPHLGKIPQIEALWSWKLVYLTAPHTFICHRLLGEALPAVDQILASLHRTV